jgi:hypothetical protein
MGWAAPQRNAIRGHGRAQTAVEKIVELTGNPSRKRVRMMVFANELREEEAQSLPPCSHESRRL